MLEHFIAFFDEKILLGELLTPSWFSIKAFVVEMMCDADRGSRVLRSEVNRPAHRRDVLRHWVCDDDGTLELCTFVTSLRKISGQRYHFGAHQG